MITELYICTYCAKKAQQLEAMDWIQTVSLGIAVTTYSDLPIAGEF